MSWLKVDDCVTDDATVDDAGFDAFGALVCVGAWSAKHLTDGRVPIAKVRKLVGPSRMATMVRVGWLVEEGAELVITTGLIHVRPAVEVLAERAAAAARQKVARDKAAAARAAEAAAKAAAEAGRSAGSHGVTIAATAGATHAARSPVSNGPPDPTRPDPTDQLHTHTAGAARVEATEEPPPWGSITLRALGAAWNDETAAYEPDASGLEELRQRLEGVLRAGSPAPLPPEEVTAFAKAACRSWRQIAEAWAKKDVVIGITPWNMVKHLGLVQRVMRDEVSPEQLAVPARAASGGGRGGGGGGGAGRIPIARGRT